MRISGTISCAVTVPLWDSIQVLVSNPSTTLVQKCLLVVVFSCCNATLPPMVARNMGEHFDFDVITSLNFILLVR